MKVGVFCGGPGIWTNGDFVRASAQACERAGFDTYWFGEHMLLFGSYTSEHPFSSGPIPDPTLAFPDPIIGMTWAAACTSRIEVGSAIIILPQHNPVKLAKEISCLDHFSHGRVALGVAVGWCREEAAALGVEWTTRGRRADEYIDAMRVLWGNDAAEFHGETVSFSDAYMYPTPVRDRQVPILIGGDSEAAMRRVARGGDGWLAFNIPVAEAKDRVERIKAMTREYGRDPDALRLSIGSVSWTSPDDIERFRDAGFNELMLFKWGDLSLDEAEMTEQLAETAREYERFRG